MDSLSPLRENLSPTLIGFKPKCFSEKKEREREKKKNFKIELRFE